MPSTQVDLLLFDSMKAGDVHAFRILIEKYSAGLHTYCLRYVKSECDAEEIIADVFIILWDRKERINISSNLKAYLYTTVKNQSINYLRTIKNNPTIETIEEEGTLPDGINMAVYPFESTPEQRLQERMKILEEALEHLPPQRRKVFLLFKSGLKYSQIAAQLNLSEKTVRNQIDRAMKQLKQYVEDILPLSNAFTLFLLTAYTL